MKIELNDNKELVEMIQNAVRANDGYCPCAIEKTLETKCMCKDFRENIPVGEFCHCGIYKKVM